MKFRGKTDPEGPVDLSKPPCRRYFTGLRNLAMLWLMYDFDLTAREVTELKWHAVDLTGGRFKAGKKKAGKETQSRLNDELLEIMQKWRDCQAKSTFYRALEHVFTDAEGRPVSPRYVQLLLLGLIIYTFLPLNFLPIERADRVLDR